MQIILEAPEKRRRKRSASPVPGKFKRLALFNNAFASIEDILKLDDESTAYDGDYPPDELDDLQDNNIYDLLSLSDSKG